jgi:hypothetical protein
VDVRVDHAWEHEQFAGVELLAPAALQVAPDRGDAPVDHADVLLGPADEQVERAHWSSSLVPADGGRAPASLAPAEGHDETSASRRSVEVPAVATGSRATRAPSVSTRQGTSPPVTVNVKRSEE